MLLDISNKSRGQEMMSQDLKLLFLRNKIWVFQRKESVDINIKMERVKWAKISETEEVKVKPEEIKEEPPTMLTIRF